MSAVSNSIDLVMPQRPRTTTSVDTWHMSNSFGKELTGTILSGTTEVRLATTMADVNAAQALRYRVFYKELGAVASPETAALELDFDKFDFVADHLLVVDHALGGAIVGTYRLMRRRAADQGRGFYSTCEYDISRLISHPGEIMELGRSCIDSRYRNRTTMQLMWRGIAAYVFHHEIEIMFGCASLPGRKPHHHAAALSYLHHFHLAPAALRPRAHDERFVIMDRLPRDAIDQRHALSSLPPLLKGYLRLGGWVGDGAVVDHQFNTTDVCVVVQTDSVSARYYKHYNRTARVGVAG